MSALILLWLTAAPATHCDRASWTHWTLESPCPSEQTEPTTKDFEQKWKVPRAVAKLAAEAWAHHDGAGAKAAWLKVIKAAPACREALASLRLWVPRPEALVEGIEATDDPEGAAAEELRYAGSRDDIAAWLISRGRSGVERVDNTSDFDALSLPVRYAVLTRLEQKPEAVEKFVSRLSDEGHVALVATTYLEAKKPAQERMEWDPALRDKIALALLIEGKNDAAARLAQAHLRPPNTGPGATRAQCNFDLVALALSKVLRASAGPSDYELRIALRTCRPESATLMLLAARFPKDKDHLATLASYPLMTLLSGRRWKATIDTGPLVQKYLGRELKQVHDAIEKDKERYLALGAKDPHDGQQAGSGLVSHPWKEVADAKTATGAKGTCIGMPEGFSVISARKQGQECVAIAASQAIDPTGEVSRGGYWLFVSKEGWFKRGVYTGLRIYRPYEIADDAALELTDGVVRVAVTRKVLNEQSISFPPVGTRFSIEGTPAVLEAKLADLIQDTDRDGLSDLEEERLLLDPKNPDSDGDGTKDGDDMLPNVADSPTPSPMAALLNQVLETLSAGKPAALITAPGPADGGLQLPQAHRKGQMEVTFLRGDATQLKGLRSMLPMVVIDPKKESAAEAKFGSFYPRSFDIVIDESNTHAMIWWDEGWVGGSYSAELKNGVWQLQEVESWIT